MSFGIGEKSQSSRGRTQLLMEDATDQEQTALAQAGFSSARGNYLLDQEREAAFALPSSSSYLEQLRGQLETKSAEALYHTLQGGGIIGEADRAAIAAIYDPITQAGMEDIKKMANDFAAQRGLAPSDAPIGDHALQEARKFQRDIGSARGQAALDLGKFSSAQNQSMMMGLGDFQERLKQQALQNRMSLAAANPAAQFQDQLYGQRLARAGQTYNNRSVGSQWNAGIDIGQILGAVAGAAGCWVAAAVYGAGTPEWWLTRQWVMHEAPRWFRSAYLKVGPWVGQRPRLARLLKPLFDRVQG